MNSREPVVIEKVAVTITFLCLNNVRDLINNNIKYELSQSNWKVNLKFNNYVIWFEDSKTFQTQDMSNARVLIYL